jgi:phage-related protein
MGDGTMILLHGFIKKTQKTPQAVPVERTAHLPQTLAEGDIDLALKRKREVT